jgi:hypothetical protein
MRYPALATAPFKKSLVAVSHALLACSLLSACGKSRTMVMQAERKAQIGGEFIRLYDDGTAEYGYGVVSEKLKAEGAYRYANDTLHLLDASFKPHFPKGHLVVKEGVVIMESGFHFLVTQSHSQP